MLPRIENMLTTNAIEKADEIDYMKILIALFAYAKFGSPRSQLSLACAGELQYWPLKSIVEMNSLRFSLYSSLQDLRTELKSHPKSYIYTSSSYEKYLCWLQLFVMAH
jgi:hypothetical protein